MVVRVCTTAPSPQKKIVPLTAQLKSPSGNPCYDYYHFQLKYPRKAVAYRRKWCHLTRDAGVTWTVGIANDRQQLENGASALISLERWRKATVRCPVVMMRTLWTLLTKICNVQFVMWLYENRFWLDVAIDFVKNAWSDTWWGTLNISFCYLILPHGCKKKISQESKDVKKALLGKGFHFWLGGKHGHGTMHYNFLQFRKLHAILRS